MSDPLSKMQLMAQTGPVLAVNNREEVSGRADWTDLLQQDRGRFESHVYNCEIALENAPELAGKIRLNSFAEQIEAAGELPWDRSSPSGKIEDGDIIAFQSWLNRHGMKPSKETAFDAMVLVGQKNRFNPLQDYLKTVGSAWDGVQRLGGVLLDLMDVEQTGFSSAAMKRWMISAVARAIEPGCKVDTMVVLEGKQGARKSSLLAVLAVKGDWFLETLKPIAGDSKAAQEQLPGKWLVEMAELSTLKGSKAPQAKAFISTATDNRRASYGKIAKDYPRGCVFAGTTNETSWLQDSTGGRRFWPLAIGDQVDLDGIKEIVDQLWGEAFSLYQQGEQWWLTDEEEELAGKVQDSRRQRDELESVISEYIDTIIDHNKKAGVTTIRIGRSDLKDYLSGIGFSGRGERQVMDGRIAKAIQTLPGRFTMLPDRKTVYGPGRENKGRKQDCWEAMDADYVAEVLPTLLIEDF